MNKPSPEDKSKILLRRNILLLQGNEFEGLLTVEDGVPTLFSFNGTGLAKFKPFAEKYQDSLKHDSRVEIYDPESKQITHHLEAEGAISSSDFEIKLKQPGS